MQIWTMSAKVTKPLLNGHVWSQKSDELNVFWFKQVQIPKNRRFRSGQSISRLYCVISEGICKCLQFTCSDVLSHLNLIYYSHKYDFMHSHMLKSIIIADTFLRISSTQKINMPPIALFIRSSCPRNYVPTFW
jgi:hypothetical protein